MFKQAFLRDRMKGYKKIHNVQRFVMATLEQMKNSKYRQV